MKLKNKAIFGGLLALGMLFSLEGFSWHGGGWHGAGFHGGWHGGGWHGRPGWGYYPGWRGGYYGGGVVVNPVVYPYARCWVNGHYNRYGRWVYGHPCYR